MASDKGIEMAEVTSSKRPGVTHERFQSRMNIYRSRSNECAQKYGKTVEAMNKQDLDQTIFLKQKFLQNKEKRGSKKKLDNPNNNPSMVSILPLFDYVRMYVFARS